jgi:hypothetical protein
VRHWGQMLPITQLPRETSFMAGPLRIEYPGVVCHVTTRGNGKQRVFENDRDRQFFLELLDRIGKRFRFICHACCLKETIPEIQRDCRPSSHRLRQGKQSGEEERERRCVIARPDPSSAVLPLSKSVPNDDEGRDSYVGESCFCHGPAFGRSTFLAFASCRHEFD